MPLSRININERSIDMTQFIVTGMTCAACQARVEKAVGKVAGVTSVSVSLLTNSMGVEGEAEEADVIRAVEEAGYGARLKNGPETKENKDKAIASVARNGKDVGSPEVQVAILTARIKEVTEHVKNNKHDFMAKRGLIQMVGKRKKLLKYLEDTDFELYKETVKKLGLRK